jgi:hypothetical protein
MYLYKASIATASVKYVLLGVVLRQLVGVLGKVLIEALAQELRSRAQRPLQLTTGIPVGGLA